MKIEFVHLTGNWEPVARVALLPLLLLAALAAGDVAEPADAAFPGTPGLIAFSSARPSGGLPHLWVVDPDGRNARRFVPGFASETNPQWSPDGRRILFTTPQGIYIAAASGARPTRVARYARDAAWAPDGRRLVLVGGTTKSWCSDLYIFELASRQTRRLTTTRTCEQEPQWSPDGSLIAFESDSTDSDDVVVITPDGRNRSVIARQATRPAWSPDGRSLAMPTNGGVRVVTVADAKGRIVRLVSDPRDSVLEVDWSPAGDAFVYTRAEPSPAKYGTRIHTARLDGTGDTLVTQGEADRSPDWQPVR